MEQSALTDMQESRGTVEDLSRKTRHLERQVRELLERLDDTEEKVLARITGQISLKASVADTTREDGRPLPTIRDSEKEIDTPRHKPNTLFTKLRHKISWRIPA